MPTPNMALTLPVPTQDIGPEWASTLNDALEAIDQHDHTTGNGMPITVAAIDIDDDVNFYDGTDYFGLLNLRLVNLANQANDPATVRSLYTKNGELFWINGAGEICQMTLAGDLNIGATPGGGFGGDYGAMGIDAIATYDDATKTFAFFQEAGQFANIAGGSISIAEPGEDTPNAITLSSPAALASAYELTLFAAMPADDELVQLASDGTLSTVPYTTVTNRTYNNVGNASASQTVDFASGESQSITLTQATTVDFDNHVAGNIYFLRVLQDGTGGWNVTWDSAVKWQDAQAPVLDVRAGAFNSFMFVSDGTNLYGFKSPNGVSKTLFISNTSSLAIGTTFASPTLADPISYAGTPVVRSTNTLTFPWIGPWSVEFLAGNVQGGTQRRVLSRLRNTTDNATMATSVAVPVGGFGTGGGSPSEPMLGLKVFAGIADISKGYQFQMAASGAGLTMNTETVDGQGSHSWWMFVKYEGGKFT